MYKTAVPCYLMISFVYGIIVSYAVDWVCGLGCSFFAAFCLI
jgi:hypothetical protein